MSLIITVDVLRRFHHHSVGFLPNEIAAIMIGYRDGENEVFADFVHSRIVTATERMVQNDMNDFLLRATRYYALGHIHTHPSARSEVVPSDKQTSEKGGDRSFYEWTGPKFRRRTGHPFYGMIYAPYRRTFSVHNEYGTLEYGKDYRVESR